MFPDNRLVECSLEPRCFEMYNSYCDNKTYEFGICFAQIDFVDSTDLVIVRAGEIITFNRLTGSSLTFIVVQYQ